MRQRALGRRGATTIFVALSLAALLGLAALAVDMGMLLKVKADAQRVADAAALAGAAVFLDANLGANPDTALTQAVQYAAVNYMGTQQIDTNGIIRSDSGADKLGNAPDAYVQVLTDSAKVRVFIRRPIRTWFAQYFKVWGTNFDSVMVSAKAAAQVVDAGSAKCVKPLALSDIWNPSSGSEDVNGNRLPDTDGSGIAPEDWHFQPGDQYSRFNGPGALGNPTGYGSGFRNGSGLGTPMGGDPAGSTYLNDYGRPVVLNTQNQWSPQANPAFTHNVTLPVDSSHAQAYAGSDPGNPAAWQAWNIDNCNPAPISIGAPLPTNPTAPPADSAAIVDSTTSAVQRLLAQDPNACWASTTDPITGVTTGAVKQLVGGSCTGDYPGWQSSARVITVPVFDPNQITGLPGNTSIAFNNFAVVFVDNLDPLTNAINGRLLFFAKSVGTVPPPGSPTGSLIKKLQLVE